MRLKISFRIYAGIKIMDDSVLVIPVAETRWRGELYAGGLDRSFLGDLPELRKLPPFAKIPSKFIYVHLVRLLLSQRVGVVAAFFVFIRAPIIITFLHSQCRDGNTGFKAIEPFKVSKCFCLGQQGSLILLRFVLLLRTLPRPASRQQI